jgi:hypothetical protein
MRRTLTRILRRKPLLARSPEQGFPLPDDVLFAILALLPDEDIFVLACVCTTLRRVTVGPPPAG